MSKRTLITDLSLVPTFDTEAEEVKFWDTHSLDASLFSRENAEVNDMLPPPRARRSPKSFRLDAEIERRLKALASALDVPYQTLMKQFISERLYEEEKRHHLV